MFLILYVFILKAKEDKCMHVETTNKFLNIYKQNISQRKTYILNKQKFKKKLSKKNLRFLLYAIITEVLLPTLYIT